jgi:nitric oxide reductase large subunit
MLSPSTRGRLLQTKSAGSRSFVVWLQARNQVSKPSTKNGAYSMTTCSKIDDLRSRSMCVWYFACLVMKIWPHCNLVLMYRWWL